jgi:hypothetical protein
MITDPFGRLALVDADNGGQLVDRSIDDNIPNDLKPKLIGLAICAPDVLALAGEGKFFIRFPAVPTLTSCSDCHASDQRSGFDDADPRHHLILPSVDQCSVRFRLIPRHLLTRSIMAGTQTPIVYPESALGWFLLSMIAVSGRGCNSPYIG